MISTSAETLISVAMLSEIKSRMGREADDFIVAVGERIGAACSFDFNGGLEPFTVALNDIWAELGFGKAHLSMERGALLIRHQLPHEVQDASVWRDTLPLLVEGVYRSWFHHFSTHGNLSRISSSGSELEFIFSE